MQRILALLLIAGLIAAAPGVWAAPVAYTLVKEKSYLKFFAIQNNAPTEGKFSEFTADILFDPEDTAKSKIAVEVDVGSIVSANEEVATNLKLPEWLSVAKFPKAQFTSTKITRMPYSDNYYAEGKLTLRGKTVPVELNFQLKQAGEATIANGYVTLRRNDFGIGQGEWAKVDVIKNEVRVEFRILAEKKAP